MKVLLPINDSCGKLVIPYFCQLIDAIYELLPEYGWEVFVCDRSNAYEFLKDHNDIKVVFCVQASGFQDVMKYKKENSDVKIVVSWDDIHYFDEKTKKSRHNMFSKADIILLQYYDSFISKAEYKEYHHKAMSLPFSVGDSILNINMAWEDRKDKVLLSGAVSKSYPLRSKIYGSNIYNMEKLKHPGYHGKRSHAIIREDYPLFISKYKAAIATTGGGLLNYTVLKYFEIMGSGCLCLAEKTIDLNELGFVPNIHYIPISKSNYKKVIDGVDFKNGREIADSGRKFIESNHSFRSRMNIVDEALNKCL
jgi:hypothetical protein